MIGAQANSKVNRALKAAARIGGITRPRAVAWRMAAERHWLANSRQRRVRNGGRILCYHSVGQPDAGGLNDVSPRRFRDQIDAALALGFCFVPAAQIATTGGATHDLAITFDDGWTSVARTAAPILAEYRIPWSLFVVSGWSAGTAAWSATKVLGWRAIAELAEHGVDIGSHSVTHPDFGRLSTDQARDELIQSRAELERQLGRAPTSFAIPFGQSMNWTAAAGNAAREAGYETIYAQAENTRPYGTVARTFVSTFDNDRIFNALLGGAFDDWEEWT